MGLPILEDVNWFSGQNLRLSSILSLDGLAFKLSMARVVQVHRLAKK